ncbi:MAG TPA: cytidylate kinase-like family protein [Prolixibacteraceae bacterium]|nr:cytidylate kinase-like family protein [Prolixibacteraceae bacterium]
MKNKKPLIITISRQLGCGGSFIGQQLAQKLNIHYSDREILSGAARELSTLEEEIESREEKLLSFWNSFFHIEGYVPEANLPPRMNFPFDREIYESESNIIHEIAKEHAAVIMGRCGFYILNDHPGVIRLYLYADVNFRNKRIREQLNVSEKEALDMITASDKERSHYIEKFTGRKWNDARNFDLCLNTGKIGLDKSVEFIMKYLEIKKR